MYQLERVDDTQDQDSFFCSAGKLPNTVKKDAESRGIMAIETLGHLCTIGLRSITPPVVHQQAGLDERRLREGGDN